MPFENIRFVVSGANPQTKTVQVSVDPTTGAASASFVLAGVNAGTDTVEAFMDSQSLSSNTAQVNWQQTNGPFAVGPVTTVNYGGTGYNYTGLNSQIGGPYTGNSLVFNQVSGSASRGVPGFPITGFSTTDGNTGAYKRVPISNQQQSSTGVWVSDTYYYECTSGFNSNHQGAFVVTQPGNYTLYFLVDDSWALFVGGGATRVAGAFQYGVTSKAGLPQIGSRQGPASIPYEPVDNVILNFPTAGIYPFEIGHGSGNGQQAYMVVTYDLANGVTPTLPGGEYGQDILPIAAIQSVPPAPATGTGNLLLTPTGGATNLLVQGSSLTLNLQIQNIQYTQKPYIPLLEGVTGSLAIYTDPTANTFSLPEFNGDAVDPNAAAAAILNLSGDNASWKNRLAVGYNGSEYVLTYNGAAFDPNVPLTNLTITDLNIAWYNPTTKSFDLFASTGQGGGASLEIEVDYLVQPAIASITPSALPADGSTQQFLLSLAKPLHPLQTATTAYFTGTGGITVTGSVANLNAAGCITGWTITATLPVSSTTVNASIVTSLDGSPIYLNGTTFTTGYVVAYLNGVSTAISLTGILTSNPQNYAFLVTSNGNPAAVDGVYATCTFTCTISAATSSFGTLYFRISQFEGSFTNINIACSPTNVRQVGSTWLADYSLTGYNTLSLIHGVTYQMGYTETQTDGTVITYTDTNLYVCQNPAIIAPTNPGCPTLDMMVTASVSVADLVRTGEGSKQELDCLEEDFETIAKYRMDGIQTSEEPCYRIVTENGCDWEGSHCTPVPTVETTKAIADNQVTEATPSLAAHMEAGMHVYTDVGNGLEISAISSVAYMGMKKVARLFVGGRNFAAGRDSSKRLFTHNSILVVK